MNSESAETFRRYLAGEVDLESAAESIHSAGEWGTFYTTEETSPADQERIQALMGRLLWLSMRNSPEGGPEEPLGAADIRDMLSGKFFDDDDPGDRS